MNSPAHLSGKIGGSKATIWQVIVRTYQVAAATQGHGRNIFRRWRKRFYFAWVALLHPRFCRDWYHFLDTTPIQPILALNPALPLKPLKPYLSRSLDIDQRGCVMQDTLLFLTTHWEIFHRILAGHNSSIVSIALGDSDTTTLCLEYNRQKEGELTLLLRAADGRVAAMSSFAFERNGNGDYVMRIGRIQGVKDHALMKRLEKAMHGLRPKSLMLFATQEFARSLGIKEIFGVSNANQVYINKVLIPIPGLRKLSFDYDEFWNEVGGIVDSDGWFRLPISLDKRNISEIKSSKRSMYKKRYAMLDDIACQLRIVVNLS